LIYATEKNGKRWIKLGAFLTNDKVPHGMLDPFSRLH
jgi:hypothetical protein